MQDLWPDNLEVVEAEAPVILLRRQAALLGQKTGNLVEAEVRQWDSLAVETTVTGYAFGHSLDLVAPALGDYRYQLLSIFNNIDLYPVAFRVDKHVQNEIAPGNSDYLIMAESQDDFLEMLGKILKSKRTQRIIKGMLAQMDVATAP